MVDLLDFSEQIKTFYLVRHGETAATKKKQICGSSDEPLSKEGAYQAEVLADWFADIQIDSVFSSPLIRCAQSADMLAKAVKKSMYYKHSGLVEKKEGDWEGKTYWQIRDEDSKLWEKWSNDPINVAAPGGETVKDFVARVGRAWKDIRENPNCGNKTILSTHAGVVRAMMIHALDIPVENFFRIDVPLGSVTRVDWSESYSTLKFSGLCPELTEVLLA